MDRIRSYRQIQHIDPLKMPVIGMCADPTQIADPHSTSLSADSPLRCAPVGMTNVNNFRLRTLAGGGSDGGGGEDVIHAAGAVAFCVEGHVEEAERLDGGGDFFEDGEREGAGEVFAGDFDAG